jgi:hypothetical protein
MDVTLLERRGRLGGRTHAMRAGQVDDLPDNGQHVIASGYEHLFRYLTSVGTREFVVHPDATVTDRLRAARASLRLGWQALHPPADLADLSTYQWFDRVGMPAPAREALWDWLDGVAAATATHVGAVTGTGGGLDRHRLVGDHGERCPKCRRRSRIAARSSARGKKDSRAG